jgi:hypothetical protein
MLGSTTHMLRRSKRRSWCRSSQLHNRLSSMTERLLE